MSTTLLNPACDDCYECCECADLPTVDFEISGLTGPYADLNGAYSTNPGDNGFFAAIVDGVYTCPDGDAYISGTVHVQYSPSALTITVSSGELISGGGTTASVIFRVQFDPEGECPADQYSVCHYIESRSEVEPDESSLCAMLILDAQISWSW